MLNESPAKIINSSFVNKYFKSLFSLGTNNRSRIIVSQVVFSASILLSAASLYTTTVGLSELVHVVVAVTIALGIQGLLFGASWRLGIVWGTDESTLSLRIIYIVTFISSITFSYISIFNTLYPENQREIEELNSVKSDAFNLLTTLNNDLISLVDTTVVEVQKDYNTWYTDNRSRLEVRVNDFLGPYKSKIAIYDQMDNIAEIERTVGYTPDSPGGGTGRRYRELRSAADEYYRNEIAPYGYRVIQTDSGFKLFLDASKKILSESKYVTIENMNQATSAVINIASVTNTDNVNEVPESILSRTRTLSPLTNFIALSAIPFDTMQSINLIKKELVSRVNMLGDNSLYSKTEALNDAIQIDKFTGGNYPPFAIALFNLVPRFNVLALFAFVIALFIDGLVLACGILGSNPQSVLQIKSTKTIEEYSEDAIQASILAIATTNKTMYVDEIKNIIGLIKPSLETAKSAGIPAKIYINDVKSGPLLSLMSSLVTLNLAKLPKGFKETAKKALSEGNVHENYYIGIDVKLLFWLNEQLIIHSEANDTFTKFIESLKA